MAFTRQIRRLESVYRRTKLGVTVKLAYILIYLIPFVGGLLFLISDGRDRDIRYHCVMAIYLTITEALAILILVLLGKIPYLGWLFTFILWVISLFYVATMLLSMVRAWNDKTLSVPFFHKLVERSIQ